MNILFLSNWYPFPPTNGSELRISNLCAGLAEHHDVTLLAFRGADDRDQGQEAVSRVNVKSLPRRAYDPASIRALTGFASRVPRALLDTYVPEMDSLIRSELNSNRYDVVIASELKMASYYPAFQDHPSIFEDLEVGIYHSKRESAGHLLGRWRHRLSWFKLRAYLQRAVSRFDLTTVVSGEEREHLMGFLPGGPWIEVVPNGVDVSRYREVHTADPAAPTLISAGSMTYAPNYDAMAWFVSEILPTIRREIPSVKLLITGNPGERPLPNSEGVELTGYVDDVRPLIASAEVSVVPLRLGGGTRLKILEAMALGTAVVSTAKGAEGLELESGHHLVIADEPQEFAQAVIRLLEDEEFRKELTSNACRVVAAKYDWSVILPRFVELVEEVSRCDQKSK